MERLYHVYMGGGMYLAALLMCRGVPKGFRSVKRKEAPAVTRSEAIAACHKARKAGGQAWIIPA